MDTSFIFKIVFS